MEDRAFLKQQVNLENEGGGTPPVVPVYSPGDLVVTQVRASEHLGAGLPRVIVPVSSSRAGRCKAGRTKPQEAVMKSAS